MICIYIYYHKYIIILLILYRGSNDAFNETGYSGFSPNGSNIRVGNAPGALGTTLAAQSKAMVVNCHISMENDNS